MNLTYNQAYTRLTQLVAELEDEKIQLDTLDGKVKEAKELITFCETRLRTIEGEVKKSLDA